MKKFVSFSQTAGGAITKAYSKLVAIKQGIKCPDCRKNPLKYHGSPQKGFPANEKI